MSRLILAWFAALVAAPVIIHPGDVPPAWAPWQPLDLRAAPNFTTALRVIRTDSAPELCHAALASGGAEAPQVAGLEASDVCHIRNAVRPARLGLARLYPTRMRCNIALRLALWEHHDLQPAARAHLGTGVREILHLGAYSCRRLRNASGLAQRMSQHATANAFDISGFQLADGRMVTLRRDWTGGGPEAAFLRAARDGLCRWFRVVLSPDYNALHADHFHVDQGPFLSCR
ncbi:MAG: extensin family protein [Pseudomonadota bacterium]